MKKIKSSAVVLLSGILVTSGIAFAAPTAIQAFLQPDFRISINNEFKYHPEGLQPIVYQDRTYLPAAYIAEQLGAKVSFDSSSKIVSITSDNTPIENQAQEIEEYKEKITELENRISELEDRKSTEYDKLPTRKTQNGYTLRVEGLSVVDGNDGRLYFNLENINQDGGIKIQPLSTVLTIDGKEYKAGQTFQNSIDRDLFNWIDDDNEVSSFIPFRNLPDEEDISEVTITFIVESNQFDPTKEIVIFNVIND